MCSCKLSVQQRVGQIWLKGKFAEPWSLENPTSVMTSLPTTSVALVDLMSFLDEFLNHTMYPPALKTREAGQGGAHLESEHLGR